MIIIIKHSNTPATFPTFLSQPLPMGRGTIGIIRCVPHHTFLYAYEFIINQPMIDTGYVQGDIFSD
eukprot:Pgem_evm1s19312